jgi:glutamyl-tRNA synthetase
MDRKKPSVRVRIAPSPTGFAHVGTAYTALFNYAFAKNRGGKFIIRIEDTDVKRNVEGAEEAIFDGLGWLGLSWDEAVDKGGKFEPYRSSDRLNLYKEKIEELIKKGLAYRDSGAIRFKNPGSDIEWKDLIHGKVHFPGDQVTDFVIQKSDGYPTYNFAVVVDDIAMKVTHVIRGEEHISNTPRQLALYKAFNVTPPLFAHHPTLRNKDHKKLSKRRDPVDLRIYQKQGYLPEALVNFLALLGWSHPEEKEIFDIDEFVKLFSLDRVRKAGPIFNIEKLDWMNEQYIKNTENSKLKTKIYEFYDGKYPQELVGKITPLVKERINTLAEFENLASFFFKKPKVDKRLLGDNSMQHLETALSVLSTIDNWNLENINTKLMDLIKAKNFHTGKFFMDLRIAISGSRVTPPINESMVILGKEETVSRLKKLVN